MKSIYSYKSYRAYLRDFYDFQKKLSPAYTYKKFSEKASIRSMNYLKLVMDGSRDLTVANIHQFSKALGLTPDEIDFFETLVFLEQARLSSEKGHYQKRLEKLKKLKPSKGIHLTSKELVSKWFYPALIVSLDKMPSDINHKEVAKKLHLRSEQVSESIQVLLKEGLLRIHDGYFTMGFDTGLQKDAKSMNQNQKRYLKSQLELSSSALDKKYENGGKFYSHTFTGSPERIAYYNQLLYDRIQEIIVEADKDDEHSILQLNVQMFSI